MGLLALEHSRAAGLADFAFYGLAVLGLASVLLVFQPVAAWPGLAALAAAGLVVWTGLEYLLHRFVLHGASPFAELHATHHRRPRALIGTPTVVSAALLALLVAAPLWWALGLWRAAALTWGVVAGYLAYSAIHHAAHHMAMPSQVDADDAANRGPGGGGGGVGKAWRTAWLRHTRRWHARHHHGQPPGCYGVTTRFWDHVFGSAGPR